MSKDIRSFFSTLKTSSSNKNTSSTTQEIGKKLNNRKRAIVISDSDSDEDLKLVEAKRSKPFINGKVKHCNKIEKEDSKTITKSKHFPLESVKVDDVFGSGPIKRDNARKIIKKTVVKEEKEFHIDEDFELELLKLDKLDADILEQSISKEEHVDKTTTKTQQKVAPSPTKLISPEKRKANTDHDSECNTLSSKKQKLHKKDDSKTELEKSPKKEKHSKVKVVDFYSFKNTEGLNSNKASKISSSSEVIGKKSPSKSPRSDNSVPVSKKQLNVEVDSTKPALAKDENAIKSKEIKVNGLINNNGFAAKRTSELDKPKSVIKETVEPLTSPKNKKSIQDNVPAPSSLASNLWVEKYKPISTKQIIGQQGDKSCVSKLKHWLQNWQKNQSSSKKLVKPSPWAKNDDGAYFKAALLTGPPGVGKTTTAHLVCKELGLDIVEFNASDTRSKKSLQQEVSELLSSSSLSTYCTGNPDKEKRVSRQHVLLMDEVDGMAGNEDRGGVQQLILLIKQARVPIICMCNDRNHPKIRSLANHCFDLRFSKPRAEQIRGAMMSVCFKEKIKLTPDALTEIITSANQDIRLILNHLSMLSADNTKLSSSSKHIKLGPWDITRKIFSEEEHKSMSINDKCDLFFHDYSVTPLFVQENYLHAVPHKPEAKNKIKKMELFAKAARSLSYGDLTERSIRSHNAWGLLPVQAVFSSLVPGEVLEGHLGGQICFPAWFGKNSRQTKMSRLIQELTVHSRLKISGNKEAMNLDYLGPLESNILHPLVSEGVDGVPAALAALAEYSLVREDIESLSELCSWPNSISRFSRVDSKVKAAFTRAYNKANVVTPYAAAPIKKSSRVDVDPELLMGEEDEGQSQEVDDDNEEEDGLQGDAMIVVKKVTSKKSDKEDKPSSSKGNKNPKRGRKK